MAKPHCYPAKPVMAAPRPVRPRRTSARIILDLYLLRDAAADERGAIADYLLARQETCLDEIFRMLPKMRWRPCGNDAAYFLA